jgi:cyclic pyranopterin phosphate synthase
MALFDLYNRRINYLRISVIDRCNLRCVYCMPEHGLATLPQKEILTYEEICRIADYAVRNGITKIRITGGEPLIRKGVVGLIRRLGRIPGLVDISLTTNGTLLKGNARSLYEAGVRRINVSLDTLDSDRFRSITRRGTIDQVWEGIHAAEYVGFHPIKLNVVVLKGVNDDEIPDFVRLAIAKPYHVRFIEFMPTGAGPYQKDRYLATGEIIRRVGEVAKISPLPPHINEGPARRYRIEGGKGSLGFISSVSSHFCDTCNRLRLTADGRLRSCLFSDREINLKPVLRGGDKGMEERLKHLFHEALRSKPAGHRIHPGATPHLDRTMSGIGG